MNMNTQSQPTNPTNRNTRTATENTNSPRTGTDTGYFTHTHTHTHTHLDDRSFRAAVFKANTISNLNDMKTQEDIHYTNNVEVTTCRKHTIGDFPVAFYLCFKARPSAKPFIWELVLFT